MQQISKPKLTARACDAKRTHKRCVAVCVVPAPTQPCFRREKRGASAVCAGRALVAVDRVGLLAHFDTHCMNSAFL